MASLLHLPSELLLTIFEYVVRAEKEPPLDFSRRAGRARMDTPPCEAWFGRIHGHLTRCEADRNAYRPTAFALLDVNRKLRNDSKAIIGSLPLVYKLDLAVVKAEELWPTWTSIPAYRSTVDVMQVSIHVGGPPPRSTNRTNPLGRYSITLWCWWFYCMLEAFFTLGIVPHGFEADGHAYLPRIPFFSHIPKIATKVLDLNFVGPSIPYQDEVEGKISSNQQNDHGGQDEATWVCASCRTNCHMDTADTRRLYWGTESLHANLEKQLSDLLGPGNRKWGDILHRAIGSIRFRLNGSLQNEIHLADYLRRRWPKRYHKSYLSPWLEETNKIRELFGLERSKPKKRRSQRLNPVEGEEETIADAS